MSELKLHVLDVGQGASAVLDFGGHRYGIVDCGGSRSGKHAELVNFLAAAISAEPGTRILFLLVTHLDVDHVRAISGLMSNEGIKDRIEKLYCNDLAYRYLLEAVPKYVQAGSGIAANPTSQTALAALDCLCKLINHHRDKRDFHLPCFAPEGGSPRYPVRLNVPGVPDDFQLDLWAPSQNLMDLGSRIVNQLSPTQLRRAIFSGGEIEDWNAASIVMTISVNGRRVLLAGDANQQTWAEILDRGQWNGADIAVAWHHGARLGRRVGLDYDSHVWQQVLSKDVKIACISCGSHNRYGHPHRETIEAISSQMGSIYCTERTPPKVKDELRLDNDTVWELAKKSGGRFRIEREDKCCGNIKLSIDSLGNVTVQCSRIECDKRSKDHPCCTDVIVGKPLVAIQPGD